MLTQMTSQSVSKVFCRDETRVSLTRMNTPPLLGATGSITPKGSVSQWAREDCTVQVICVEPGFSANNQIWFLKIQDWLKFRPLINDRLAIDVKNLHTWCPIIGSIWFGIWKGLTMIAVRLRAVAQNAEAVTWGQWEWLRTGEWFSFLSFYRYCSVSVMSDHDGTYGTKKKEKQRILNLWQSHLSDCWATSSEIPRKSQKQSQSVSWERTRLNVDACATRFWTCLQ